MYQKTGATAVMAVAALIALAGCTSSAKPGASASGGPGTGAGPGGAAPAGAVLAALTKASGDNSVTITSTESGGTAGTTTKLTGVEEFQPLKSSLSVVTSGGASGSMSLQAIYDGTDFFIQDPEFSSMLGGKQWAEIDLGSAGSLGASMQALVNSFKTESPTDQLGAMISADDLKEVGTETVDGQQTTHYNGTITSAQVGSLASVDGLTAAQVQEIKSLFQAGGITTETIDLWIGSNGLPVRVTVVSTSTALGTTTSTTDFTGWGAPVTITDPPASEVGPLTLPGGLPTG